MERESAVRRRERVASVTRTGMSVNACRLYQPARARSASITFPMISNRGQECSDVGTYVAHKPPTRNTSAPPSEVGEDLAESRQLERGKENNG